MIRLIHWELLVVELIWSVRWYDRSRDNRNIYDHMCLGPVGLFRDTLCLSSSHSGPTFLSSHITRFIGTVAIYVCFAVYLKTHLYPSTHTKNPIKSLTFRKWNWWIIHRIKWFSRLYILPNMEEKSESNAVTMFLF